MSSSAPHRSEAAGMSAAVPPAAAAAAPSPAATAGRSASSRYNTSNSAVSVSSSSREKRRTSTGTAAETVGRLYKDPYAEALSWQRVSEKESATTAAEESSECALQTQQRQQRSETVRKAPPLTSARRAGSKESTATSVAAAEASTSPVRAATERAAPAEADSPHVHTSSDVVCVALPEAQATPRVSAAVAGGRLDLRSRCLTALPCLHSARGDNTDTDTTANMDVRCGHGAHGSGDSGAVRLHAVNLRENRLRTLLTPLARTTTVMGGPAGSARTAPPSSPRSSPLHCYVHVSSLDLTHNELTSIAGVEALRCLRSLRLAFNRLTSLSPLWASPYVADLDVLDVSSNCLTELMSTDDVRALESHRIRVVTRPTQAHATTGGHRSTKSTTTYKSMRLRVLYASNNALSSVPPAIYTLSHLSDLRLRRNAIASLPEGFPHAACLPALTRLDLSMNALPPAVVEAVTARVDGAGNSPAAAAASSGVAADGAAVLRSTAAPPRGNGSIVKLEISHNAVPSLAEDGAVKAGGAVTHAEAHADGATSTPQKTALSSALVHASATAESASSSAPLPLPVPSPNAARKKRKISRDVPTDAAGATSSPPSPVKRTRGSIAKADAGAATPSSPVASPNTAAVVEAPSYEGAVQAVGENVYTVNMQQWAAALQYRLSTVVKAAVNPEDAPASLTVHELLCALSDSAGSCVAGPIASPSAANGSALASAASKGPRPRLANTARVIAALLQCLPPAGCLPFPEDTQGRSLPLFIVTGITVDVAADQRRLLLYEVLAHHLIQNCVCTPKTTAVSAVTATAPVQSLNSAATRGVSPPLDLVRSNSTAKEATDSPTPALTNTSSGGGWGNAPWRAASDRGGRLPAAGGGGSSSTGNVGTAASGAATRPPALHAPLRVVHVLQCGEGSDAGGAAPLWAYLAWRRCWENACCRRRVKRHDTFVWQCAAHVDNSSRPVEAAPPPLSPDPSSDVISSAATCCSAELCPFPCAAAPIRVFEWRRLREVRPAAYSPLPAAWEFLHERVNAATVTMPPVLSGCVERVATVRGCATSLACLLLCAVEHPSAPSGVLAAATSGVSTVGTSTAAFRRLGSATDTRKRRSGAAAAAAAAPSAHEDALTRAAQARLASRRLTDRIEAEATTVAAEQVPACAMVVYSAEDVRHSQAAALVAYTQLSVDAAAATVGREQTEDAQHSSNVRSVSPAKANVRTGTTSPRPRHVHSDEKSGSSACDASSRTGSAATSASVREELGDGTGEEAEHGDDASLAECGAEDGEERCTGDERGAASGGHSSYHSQETVDAAADAADGASGSPECEEVPA